MRQLSDAAKEALRRHDKTYFALLSIDLEQPIRRTTNSFDITLENEVYTRDSALTEYEPPVSSSVVDSESYAVVLADPDGSLLERFISKPYGVSASLLIGFYDEAGNPINNSKEDYLEFYVGRVDSFTSTYEDSSRVLKVVMSSPFSDLDFVNSRYTSSDSTNAEGVVDTAFDYVFDDGGDIDLEWGKAQ